MEIMERLSVIIVGVMIASAVSDFIPEEYEIYVGGACILIMLVGWIIRGSIVAVVLLLIAGAIWLRYMIENNKRAKKIASKIRWDVLGSFALIVITAIVYNLLK